ncbi:3-hydroxyacyl-CoA dehydrogenase family protein [Zavarzinia sp. CC-PAN008]|uniref:3-hydroxyacyl-CoA dehydrogenase family protein n=1 Tax=Zavarzinia sp. CC-PAN008 TaxID=3243332 RepID=UPI003F749609
MTAETTHTAPSPLPSRPVAVIGAGNLGRRIALMMACRGGTVRVFDPAGEQVAAALAFVAEQMPDVVQAVAGGVGGRVVAAESVAAAVADAWLVVEAVPEELALKQRLFAELDRVAPGDAILATNSSSFPSSALVEGLARAERVLNTHFLMPPGCNAVEIMSCGRTDPALIARLVALLPAFGLVPFVVQVESMGFIFNRIWAAIKREALAVVAEGVAAPADVDAIFKLGLGAPGGPFRMMDNVGLDVVLAIEEHYASVREGLPEGPRALLREHIAGGRLGRKSGRGFYDYAGRGRKA